MSPGLGVELDRERSVVEIVRASLGLYRRYPLLFLILAGAVMVPYGVVVLVLTGHPPLSRAHESFPTSMLLFVLSFSLITPLISALHVHAVVSIGEGRRPALAGVALQGLRVLPAVSAAEIVATLGTIAGYVALIVPGVRRRCAGPSWRRPPRSSMRGGPRRCAAAGSSPPGTTGTSSGCSSSPWC